MRPGRSGCASRFPSRPSRRSRRWPAVIGGAGGRRSSHRSRERAGRLREPAGAAVGDGAPSHRREERLRGECKVLKPDFLDVSGLRGMRDQVPRERSAMPAHLVPLCAAPVPGPPPGQPAAAPRRRRALPCGPSSRPRRPKIRESAPSPPAGAGPRPCALSGADSGFPDAGGARPGRPAGGHRAGHRVLRRRPAARRRLDVPGAVGAGRCLSRAAGQPVLSPGPRAGRAPNKR